MQALKIASVALAGFLAVAGAWYVNGWDYESAYSRGLLDGARVGFIKGRQSVLEAGSTQADAPPSATSPVPGPA